MPELTLRDVPPRLMNELREWATLRRSTMEAAAVEMIRIGLCHARERNPSLPLDLVSPIKGTRTDG